MGRTTPLRQEVKRAFVPLLVGKGFEVDMRAAPQFFQFRKTHADQLHVCEIQWEKYGRPRFILNFGKCGAAGVILAGKHIHPRDIAPGLTPEHGRLVPGRGNGTGSWFRQDRPLIDQIVSWSKFSPPEVPVHILVSLFSEVEEFWARGSTGPHLRMMPKLRAVEDYAPSQSG